MSTERGIGLTIDMIQAVQEDRKTHTRRICKDQSAIKYMWLEDWPIYRENKDKRYTGWGKNVGHSSFLMPTKCPYGKVGDLLYVKEPYRITNLDLDNNSAVMVHYYSDRSYHSVTLTDAEMALWHARKKPFAKTPGRFMYKSLARTWLEIANVRVERVQDISEYEAELEGTAPAPPIIHKGLAMNWGMGQGRIDPAYKYQFKKLWDSINEKRGFGWAKNNWVWVIEFKRIER